MARLSTSAMECFAPNGDDWLVSIHQHDGSAFTRRISPGSMGEDDALGIALLAQGIQRSSVKDASVRRASAPVIELVSARDPFLDLMRRMR